jgi:solute carrier family 25 (mitochondrial phosphate transporter), member 3
LELGSDVSLSLSPPFLFGGADPRFFLAGGICAAFSHGITTPIDVVKTRQQVDPRKYGVGVVEAAQIIVEEEGAGALLKGLGPTIVGYGIEGAAKFGFYESLKPTMSQLLHLDNPAIPYLTASVIAGAAASIILCPLERTRIRLVTDPNFAPNLLTGIPLLVKESGFQSLFSGCPAMLSKQVPYTFGKQVSFDEVAKFLYSVVANPDNPWTKLEVSFVSAFLASIAACLLSQPGDVILTDTYKDRGSKPLRFSNVTAAIYQRQGLKGFYSGLTARLLQVGTIITSQLLLYDYIKQGLGLPATGSS